MESNNTIQGLNDKQKWVYERILQCPEYIENNIFVRTFHRKFHPERKVANRNYPDGFYHYADINLTRKEICRIFSQLKNKKLIFKKAYGIQNHLDACLGRNWVWSWIAYEWWDNQNKK